MSVLLKALLLLLKLTLAIVEELVALHNPYTRNFLRN